MTQGDPHLPAVEPPTLTEVVELAVVEDDADADEAADVDVDDDAGAPWIDTGTPLAALPSEAQLVRKVLSELERQIDVMLEYRLREVLAPLLARAADNIVRDARSELASTLRDVVARAVASELAGHRARQTQR